MKKLWLQIKGFFLLTFGGKAKFEQFLADHSGDAIDFVETIKSFIHSPLVITLMTIFPKYAAKAKPFLDEAEAFLNELLARLNLGTDCLALTDTVAKVKCMVDVIKNKPAEEQADIFQKMAVNYLQIKSRAYTVDGKELSVKEARTIVGMAHLAKAAELAGIEEADED